jgi:hypothetical protein
MLLLILITADASAEDEGQPVFEETADPEKDEEPTEEPAEAPTAFPTEETAAEPI